MISEQEAREAAAKVNELSAKLIAVDFEDAEAAVLHKGIETACDVLSQWALQELARRDWQDEPGGDGWYWLEHSASKPFKVAKRDYCGSDDETYSPGWKYESKAMWWSLDCRVCKIIDRPESRRRSRRRVKR